MSIHVVGGVYFEKCTQPAWDYVYGSAGRAAIAIASMGTQVELHAYFSPESAGQFLGDFALVESLKVNQTPIEEAIKFNYLHDLAVPSISGRPAELYSAITLKAEKVVRFGMLEGDAKVDADWAVYDPQNLGASIPFRANGSTANHLALILNTWEARSLSGLADKALVECAATIAEQNSAEVVVIKMGPQGALVWTNASVAQVPAYRTSNVWKIGSGDCFVAHFAHAWMHEGMSPVDAAKRASLATAFYCESRILPGSEALSSYWPAIVNVSPAHVSGRVRQVYLAGPFFDLAQIWMVEQAREQLRAMGLKVFSPYHDIGLGSAADVVQKDIRGIQDSDLVFAIVDGHDTGTVFEVGFARSIGRPVIVYSERESVENLKMMEGTGCTICKNFATAVYAAAWEAAQL